MAYLSFSNGCIGQLNAHKYHETMQVCQGLGQKLEFGGASICLSIVFIYRYSVKTGQELYTGTSIHYCFHKPKPLQGPLLCEVGGLHTAQLLRPTWAKLSGVAWHGLGWAAGGSRNWLDPMCSVGPMDLHVLTGGATRRNAGRIVDPMQAGSWIRCRLVNSSIVELQTVECIALILI